MIGTLNKENDMPKEFNKCRKQGGKIRTKKLKGDKYMKVCVRPKGKKGPRGGRTVGGEVHKSKTKRG
jgi:hypothetical protein